MVPVKSEQTYEEFITGRDVDAAVHREDGSLGPVAGWVEVPRETDMPINEAEYEAISLGIRAHNDSLPPPPPSPTAAYRLRAVDKLTGLGFSREEMLALGLRVD